MLFLLILSLLPAAALCAYVYRKDRVDKEPPALLAKLFFLGVVICFPAIHIESLLDFVIEGFFSLFGVSYGEDVYLDTPTFYAYQFVGNLFGVALVEEGLKWLVLFFVTRNNKNFNSFFDGIIYSVFVSLGFAAYENVQYVFSFGFSTAVMRALTAVPGHMFFAVIMGLQYSRWHALTNARNVEKAIRAGNPSFRPVIDPKPKLALSIVLPVLFHGAYDFCCSFENAFWVVMFYLLLAALYAYCFSSVRKISKMDADDMTVATWLVTKYHPEFGETLTQYAAGQPAYSPAYAANGAGAAASPAQPYASSAQAAPSPAAPVQAPQAYPGPGAPQGNAPTGAGSPAAYAGAYRTAIPAGTLFVSSGGAPCENNRPFFLPTGDCYSGEWKDGLANGMGTYYFKDGRRVTGMWVNGRTY